MAGKSNTVSIDSIKATFVVLNANGREVCRVLNEHDVVVSDDLTMDEARSLIEYLAPIAAGGMT